VDAPTGLPYDGGAASTRKEAAMGFLDKVGGNIRKTASKAREGVEELQTKRELGQAYAELGRRAFDLIDAGKLQAPELDFDTERIRKLKVDLEAEEQAASDASRS
jgi:hypothetical protein